MRTKRSNQNSPFERRITVSAASVGGAVLLAGGKSHPLTDTMLLAVSPEKLSGLKPW
jgi:hypothetical protein